MSWVLGYIGERLALTRRAELWALHDPLRHITETDGFYLATGGAPFSCQFGTVQVAGKTDPSGWCVVGMGMKVEGGAAVCLGAVDWTGVLARPVPDFTGLDGHFIALRWEAGQVEAFSDALGLRTLYVSRQPTGILFSTRLDWIRKAQGGGLDFEAMGGAWLTRGALPDESPVQGVRRLGPHGRAVLTPSDARLSCRFWTPPTVEPSEEALEAALRAFVHVRPPSDKPVSLALSGGLDSRLLLALRAPDARDRFGVHVFGPQEDPDVEISRRLADAENLPHRLLEEPLQPLELLWPQLRGFLAQATLFSQASTFLHQRHYPLLAHDTGALLDASNGELARRLYFYPPKRGWRAALRSGDPARFVPYLLKPHAPFFTPEAVAEMRRGVVRQTEKLWANLPAPSSVGEENFLDLVVVSTAMPGGIGQGLLYADAHVPVVFPFAQPSVVEAVFRTPPALRRRSRLVRRLIRQHAPALASYPLVRSYTPRTTYPYLFNTLGAGLWARGRKVFGKAYHDWSVAFFLYYLREPVLALLHTEGVKTFAAYDHPRLVRDVEAFYDGSPHLAPVVDDWLAFELWRRGGVAGG